jgi:hypothetical protein
MRALIVLMSVIFLLTACQSKDKQENSTDISDQAENEQVLALPVVENDVPLAEKTPLMLADNSDQAQTQIDVDAPVAEQKMNPQQMRSIEQQSLYPAEEKPQLGGIQAAMTAALGIPNTSPQASQEERNDDHNKPEDDNGYQDDDNVNDVNPYSVKHKPAQAVPASQQPPAMPVSKPLQQQVLPKRENKKPQFVSPAPPAPTKHAPQNTDRNNILHSDQYQNHDFDFDNLPIPVSIGGRPAQTEENSTIEIKGKLANPDQRLQQLIDRYDTEQQQQGSESDS